MPSLCAFGAASPGESKAGGAVICDRIGAKVAGVADLDESVLDGALWKELSDDLRSLQELVLGSDVPGSPQDRAEGWRYVLRFLSAGIRVVIAAGDPDYPELGRMIENSLSWGLDNPDCNYSWARLRGDAAYHIGGNRGTACHLEFQVNDGHFGDGNVGGWATISSLNARELECESDGSFDLWIGGEPRDGNWMALAPEASFLLLRQYFNHWVSERPAEIYIERIGAELPRPALTPARIGQRIEELRMWLTAGARGWENMSKLIFATEPNQVTMTQPLEGNAGLRGQSYGMGHYQCGADEALLVEFRPPRCLMWSVQLCNWYFESMEFATRQTSLNGSQAVLDDDGVFRGVISHDDPGVANWIDPEGHSDGTIGIRYLFPDQVEQPKLTRIKRRELDRHLPASTRRVSATERTTSLQARSRAIQLRYRY